MFGNVNCGIEQSSRIIPEIDDQPLQTFLLQFLKRLTQLLPGSFRKLLDPHVTCAIFISNSILHTRQFYSPSRDLHLPFLSFGGSSLVVTLAAMGVLLNIARQGG